MRQQAQMKRSKEKWHVYNAVYNFTIVSLCLPTFHPSKRNSVRDWGPNSSISRGRTDSAQATNRSVRATRCVPRSRVESSVSSISIDQIKSKWTNSVGLLKISGHCHFRHRRDRSSERKKEIAAPPPVPGALRREYSDFQIRPLFFGFCKRLGVLGLPPLPTPPPLPDCGRRGRDGEGVMGYLLFYTDPGRRESTRYRGRGQWDSMFFI